MPNLATNTLTEQETSYKNTSLFILPFKQQLLKWVGNKQRFADEIASYFPDYFGTYYEPFLGSGAVMGTLAPQKGVVSDTFLPLMEIWKTLKEDPALVKSWYRERWSLLEKDTKQQVYEQVKASYNQRPNGADFLFLSRACYGGVVRFRKADGYMSTPCGVHTPIPPKSFEARVDLWSERIAGTTFHHMDYTEAMDQAVSGDLIYCDPPYSYSQAILYGAQGFSLQKLFSKIRSCKERGVYVALSLDGSKKSGNLVCRVDIPEGLFEREVSVNCGRSMLKRFQMEGKSLENELVSDRLLLTY
jgi:DNA adenine methylase